MDVIQFVKLNSIGKLFKINLHHTWNFSSIYLWDSGRRNPNPGTGITDILFGVTLITLQKFCVGISLFEVVHHDYDSCQCPSLIDAKHKKFSITRMYRNRRLTTEVFKIKMILTSRNNMPHFLSHYLQENLF